MSDKIFTDENIADGKRSMILGPAYFSSRDFMRQFMLGLDDVDLAKPLKDFTDAIYSKVLRDFEQYLISNADSNIHDYIWRSVDEIVRGIMSGEKWIVEKYALQSRFDCEKVRDTLVKHFPEELKAGRIADLEAELKRANDELAWRRRQT